MVAYHDVEWGVPAHGDSTLFERLALESFQAGLSWSTILHKRPAFRHAFAGFEPVQVAGFDAEDVRRLLGDAGIVRNRAKIEATIANARGVIEIARQAGFVQETYGSFKGAMCFDDCPSTEYNDQFRDLWASQPQRKLGFRYGYVDSKDSYHLLATRRASLGTP